ncbi:MAG: aldo/keto reductase [Acidiferrobacterales bacterium]|nr:aldo/keto reductase [Acidiferrobacterales bacterium]
MKYNELGKSGIKVSEICLGSMTWGTQNTEAEGHAQMDLAFEKGVNFIDTAEMYPVNPITREKSGRSEEIIGNWHRSRKNREQVILATKIVGPGTRSVRDGGPVNRKSIEIAVEGSLRRLRTDYIDLYQIHWPNRGSYHFRQSWEFDPSKQDYDQTYAYILEALDGLQRQMDAGKIRAIGLSNESCWGTAKFLEVSAAHNLPRVVSMQNEYNLLDRKYDLDMSELSINENVGLLAFSPLAAGILSGQYQGDQIPADSRRNFSNDIGGRYTEYVVPVVDKYLDVARNHGLDCCQMALAFCLTRPFMASAIFGARTMEQLKANLAVVDLKLDDAVIQDIASVHRSHPNPMG